VSRLKSLNLALLAIFALGLTASGQALAEEGGNPLILATFPLTFESELEAGKSLTFETTSGVKIVCEKATSKGEFTSGRLGTITMRLKKCNTAGLSCQTAGAEAGEIVLTNADIHLVDVRINNVLTLALQILPLAGGKNVLIILCPSIGLTEEVKGSVISQLEPEGKVEEQKGGTLLVLTKHVFSLWKQEKGKQALTECELDKEFCLEGEKHKVFKLEASSGKGFEATGLLGHAFILFSVVVHIVY
jgi:hypothetical protein